MLYCFAGRHCRRPDGDSHFQSHIVNCGYVQPDDLQHRGRRGHRTASSRTKNGNETGKYEDTDDGVYINKGDSAPYVEKRADKPSRQGWGQSLSYTVTLGNAEGAVYEIENASMTDAIPAELDFRGRQRAGGRRMSAGLLVR